MIDPRITEAINNRLLEAVSEDLTISESNTLKHQMEIIRDAAQF